MSLQNVIFDYLKLKYQKQEKIFERVQTKIADMASLWLMISKFETLYNSYQKDTKRLLKDIEEYNLRVRKEVLEKEK